MKQNYESGRSMVEMLGTLAIIGVLSIGGIAGYSYGMDKHKANQTINDIMLIGIDITSQITQGKIPILAKEWGGKSSVGYTMSIVPDANDKQLYGLQLQGVPPEICKMVGDALKNTTAVYVENADETVQGDVCDVSDLNTMEFFFPLSNDVVRCTTSADCDENEVCLNKVCAPIEPEMSVWEPEEGCQTNDSCGPCAYCNTDYDYDRCVAYEYGKECTLDNGERGLCVHGNCVLDTECTYDTNKCTGENEYCAVASLKAGYGDSWDCANPFMNNRTGTCVTAKFKPFIVDGQEYLMSTGVLNWSDANAACKAVNRQLISSDDLIGNDNTLTLLMKEIQSKSDSNYAAVWLNQAGQYCRFDGYVYGDRNRIETASSCYSYYDYKVTVCK